MSAKFLDDSGLSYFWTKIKAYVSSALTGLVHIDGAETITGLKTFDNDVIVSGNIHSEANDGHIDITGGAGKSYTNGAKGVFYGALHSTAAGQFQLQTGGANAADHNYLTGTPAGALTWMRNDVTGDAHLAGAETFTGRKSFSNEVVVHDLIRRPDNAGYSSFCGGSAESYSNGAKLQVYGSSHASYPNRFALITGGTYHAFVGLADGTLTWMGNDVTGDAHLAGSETFTGVKTFSTTLLVSNTKNVSIGTPDNNGVMVIACSNSATATNGAKLALLGAGSSSSSKGGFILQSGDANGYKQLVGLPNGTLTWDGEALSGLVHTSGSETVAGVKTFSNDIATDADTVIRKTNSTNRLALYGGVSAGYTNGAKMYIHSSGYSTNTGGFQLQTGGATASTHKYMYILPDGTFTWDGNPVQTASDERLKTPLADVPDEILDAWGNVRWGQFRFLEAVERKGASARLHLGLIAQRVEKAVGSEALRYGILCHEQSPGEDGEPDRDLWTVRYDEAFAMEASYMRRENARLKKRVSDLEERLAALELKVS